jgi:hypothetical protein
LGFGEAGPKSTRHFIPRSVRPCDIWGMDEKYEVQLIEQPTGRWVYRLVVVGSDDPSAWESDANSYLTREDAERAGRLALAARLLRDRG